MLVSQLQARVNGILADDEAVLVGHDDPAEADIGFLTLLEPGLALLDVFFDEGVLLVEAQVHLPDGVLDAFLLDQVLELALAVGDQLSDVLFVPLQRPASPTTYLMYTTGYSILIRPSTIRFFRKDL